MAVVTRGTNFPASVSNEIFSKVKGHSTLAKLSPQIPVAFNGTDIFTFSMDGEIAIVAENGTKPHGGASATPVRVAPIKVVYQARVSDEFTLASEEAQLDILSAFNEGMAKKLGAGLDKMAFHGINPATGSSSEHITNSFDTVVTQTVAYSSSTGGDAAVEAAVALCGDADITGLALSRAFAGILSKETTSTGASKFPELSWGGNPEVLKGIPCDVNSTVGTTDHAIIGDFDAFRWGYAKDIAIEVIEYGDPDQTGVDLKASNQVMLRAEAYIGFAILDATAFARVTTA